MPNSIELNLKRNIQIPIVQNHNKIEREKSWRGVRGCWMKSETLRIFYFLFLPRILLRWCEYESF
jgi:hypothetical protein